MPSCATQFGVPGSTGQEQRQVREESLQSKRKDTRSTGTPSSLLPAMSPGPCRTFPRPLPVPRPLQAAGAWGFAVFRGSSEFGGFGVEVQVSRNSSSLKLSGPCRCEASARQRSLREAVCCRSEPHPIASAKRLLCRSFLKSRPSAYKS